ncbi:MAG: hypothetical protein M1824_006381 [Vezdaea acicularis]|nr:MAG: hypothetical protein M1824_006381 [Vezdaea acicularis]
MKASQKHRRARLFLNGQINAYPNYKQARADAQAQLQPAKPEPIILSRARTKLLMEGITTGRDWATTCSVYAQSYRDRSSDIQLWNAFIHTLIVIGTNETIGLDVIDKLRVIETSIRKDHPDDKDAITLPFTTAEAQRETDLMASVTGAQHPCAFPPPQNVPEPSNTSPTPSPQIAAAPSSDSTPDTTPGISSGLNPATIGGIYKPCWLRLAELRREKAETRFLRHSAVRRRLIRDGVRAVATFALAGGVYVLQKTAAGQLKLRK